MFYGCGFTDFINYQLTKQQTGVKRVKNLRINSVTFYSVFYNPHDTLERLEKRFASRTYLDQIKSLRRYPQKDRKSRFILLHVRFRQHVSPEVVSYARTQSFFTFVLLQTLQLMQVISTSPKGNKDETIYTQWQGLPTDKMVGKY